MLLDESSWLTGRYSYADVTSGPFLIVTGRRSGAEAMNVEDVDGQIKGGCLPNRWCKTWFQIISDIS